MLCKKTTSKPQVEYSVENFETFALARNDVINECENDRLNLNHFINY